MRKRKLLFFGGLFIVNLLQAQVGINTSQPQGVFHVDPLRNNNPNGAPTSVEKQDDVIVTADGNLGLGSVTDQIKVDIKTLGTSSNQITGFILEDGNQAATKVLTSDADGNATWKYGKLQGAIIGGFTSSTGVLVAPNPNLTGNFGGLNLSARPAAGFVRTSGTIILPPGRWWVKMSLYLTTQANGNLSEQVWVRTTLGDDTSGSARTKDLEASNSLASNNIWKSPGGVIVGSFIINNKAATNKKYYVMVGWIDSIDANTTTNTVFKTGMSVSSENALIAYRILE